jgi:hypothetical protein
LEGCDAFFFRVRWFQHHPSALRYILGLNLDQHCPENLKAYKRITTKYERRTA